MDYNSFLLPFLSECNMGIDYIDNNLENKNPLQLISFHFCKMRVKRSSNERYLTIYFYLNFYTKKT